MTIHVVVRVVPDPATAEYNCFFKFKIYGSSRLAPLSGREQMCEADNQPKLVRLYGSGNTNFDWIADVLGLVD